MDCVIEKLDSIDAARDICGAYTFALIYRLDGIFLDKTENCSLDWDKISEARFFNAEGELHFFKMENEDWRAVKIADKSSDSEMTLEKEVLLASKYRKIGSKVRIKEYLDEDEDGQVYVRLTRLCDVL